MDYIIVSATTCSIITEDDKDKMKAMTFNMECLLGGKLIPSILRSLSTAITVQYSYHSTVQSYHSTVQLSQLEGNTNPGFPNHNNFIN